MSRTNQNSIGITPGGAALSLEVALLKGTLLRMVVPTAATCQRLWQGGQPFLLLTPLLTSCVAEKAAGREGRERAADSPGTWVVSRADQKGAHMALDRVGKGQKARQKTSQMTVSFQNSAPSWPTARGHGRTHSCCFPEYLQPGPLFPKLTSHDSNSFCRVVWESHPQHDMVSLGK